MHRQIKSLSQLAFIRLKARNGTIDPLSKSKFIAIHDNAKNCRQIKIASSVLYSTRKSILVRALYCGITRKFQDFTPDRHLFKGTSHTPNLLQLRFSVMPVPTLPSEHEPTRTVVADQQRAELFPVSFRQPIAADNELLRLVMLNLTQAPLR